MSFDAYNECDVLNRAVENYRARTGHYPERVLADQIYRNRSNLGYCRQHGIRMLGSVLGRPKKAEKIDKREAYQDNDDRIAVERVICFRRT